MNRFILRISDLDIVSNFGFRISCFIFITILFAYANTAHAAVVIQAPKYIGLTNGLVGYWSFDPVRKKQRFSFIFNSLCIYKSFVYVELLRLFLSNGVDGKDMRGNNRKSRLRGTFRNPNTTRILAHHLVPLYSFLKSMSIAPVDISRTMEVRGFAPRGFWMMSQFPCCTTPIAELS